MSFPVAADEPASPEGVLNLSASATVEAPRDWMSLVFAASREGTEANLVQSQLKQALDAALVESRKVAKPGQVEVQTGAFSMSPRYGPKGTLNGWQGTAELAVEGRDMAALGQLAGRVNTMSISRVNYGLSRDARDRVEAEVSGQAVALFRARAAELVRQFGYAGYSIREVNLSLDQASGAPMPRLAMAMAKSADAESLPVEAGKGSVTATVNGSVQMK